MADGGFLPRRGRWRGPWPGAGPQRAEVFRAGAAPCQEGGLPDRYQARDAWKAGAGHCRWVAFHGRRDYLSREGPEGRTVQAGHATRLVELIFQAITQRRTDRARRT